MMNLVSDRGSGRCRGSDRVRDRVRGRGRSSERLGVEVEVVSG